MSLAIREVDIAAYDNHGRAVLLVEVKGTLDTSEVWAALFRRNILAHGTLPSAPFFLIATPEHMYFWRQDDGIPDDAPPQFTIDATHELKPYLERSGLTPQETRGQALVLIVFSWLNEIAELGGTRAKQDSSLRWLSESGMLDKLRRARISLSEV
jgi:hypothetical protein